MKRSFRRMKNSWKRRWFFHGNERNKNTKSRRFVYRRIKILKFVGYWNRSGREEVERNESFSSIHFSFRIPSSRCNRIPSALRLLSIQSSICSCFSIDPVIISKVNCSKVDEGCFSESSSPFQRSVVIVVPEATQRFSYRFFFGITISLYSLSSRIRKSSLLTRITNSNLSLFHLFPIFFRQNSFIISFTRASRIIILFAL